MRACAGRLTLAIDRWGGSKYLSRIAIVKTVGGVVFPKHPLAATKEELTKIAGYWPDINKSRAEAKRLLKEAGYPSGFEFTLHNRGVDQPYKVVGTWVIDQWRKIGLKVKQWVQPSGTFLRHAEKEEELRRIHRLQLPVGHQSAGRHLEVHLRRQGGQPVRAIPGSPARQMVRRR